MSTPDHRSASAVSDFDLNSFLPYRLNLAAERVSLSFSRRYRREFGLTIAEWRILAHLASGGEVSMRTLLGRANLEKSKASRAAMRLTEAGYVAKTEDRVDRRLIMLTLTEEGRALMQRLVPVAMEFQHRLEARLAESLVDFDAKLTALIEESYD